MFKNTSIGGVSWEIWHFELGVVLGHRPRQQWHGSGSLDYQGWNWLNFVNIWSNEASKVFTDIYVKRK